MLNLLLARHGQSEWNAVGRWQGQEDPPLSELGRAQARGAAAHAGSFDALFASDLERAHRVAARIESGIVWVNAWLLRDLRTPFGGVKASGVGREGGRWSLDFFSETVNVCVNIGDR